MIFELTASYTNGTKPKRCYAKCFAKYHNRRGRYIACITQAYADVNPRWVASQIRAALDGGK